MAETSDSPIYVIEAGSSFGSSNYVPNKVDHDVLMGFFPKKMVVQAINENDDA